MNRKWLKFWIVMAALAATGAKCASKADFLAEYKGSAYEDGRYHGGAQKIPGKVYCAYYDRGGEGVAYHDSDAKNNGSGTLNPADGSYLNEFRMNEGVDIILYKDGARPGHRQYAIRQGSAAAKYVLRRLDRAGRMVQHDSERGAIGMVHLRPALHFESRRSNLTRYKR